jgi:hypothetical protein
VNVRVIVHSEALELTERFSLDPRTRSLKREFVAADALFFREPYTGEDVVYPSKCPTSLTRVTIARCSDRRR